MCNTRVAKIMGKIMTTKHAERADLKMGRFTIIPGIDCDGGPYAKKMGACRNTLAIIMAVAHVENLCPFFVS